MICDICPRLCKIDRAKSAGFCGMAEKIKIAKADVFMWEEPIISGTKGSGAIFFSGCNLKCCFCQNYKISNEGFGKEISVERLAEIFCELEQKGVHNINLVSPSHYVPQIESALKIYNPKIPIVWNSNGYESVETLERVAKFADIFLMDMKFYDENLSQKYCKAKNYFDVASKAIKTVLEKSPNMKIENGILQKGVVIRHLVMPNCANDSIKILEWLKNNTNCNFVLSIMGQYVPYFNSCIFPEINRTIKPLEYKIVINKALELGFDNAYTQELESGNVIFVPDWDLKGV